jgi:hypothetical protein
LILNRAFVRRIALRLKALIQDHQLELEDDRTVGQARGGCLVRGARLLGYPPLGTDLNAAGRYLIVYPHVDKKSYEGMHFVREVKAGNS